MNMTGTICLSNMTSNEGHFHFSKILTDIIGECALVKEIHIK